MKNLLVALVVFAGLLSARPADAAPALTFVTCGEPIAQSIRVNNNLQDCPNDGLVVTASNITIDLNGHEIDGTNHSGKYGVNDVGGFDHVTVKNGYIRNFVVGVRCEGADHALLQGLTVSGGTGEGLQVLNGSTYDTIKGNFVTGIKNSGIRTDHVSNVLVTKNVSSGNNFVGILDTSSTNDVISSNQVSGNNWDGIGTWSSTGTRIINNRSISNEAAGVSDVSSTSVVITGNRLTSNTGYGIYLGPAYEATVRGNNASSNGFSGIGIYGGGGNVVTRNVASNNEDDGIHAETSSVNIDGNTANANGFRGGQGDGTGDGVTATGGVGHHNKARGNDDPAQCAPTSFCV